ncbi:PREDICTED: uncharacterized protein LOC107327186 [Acropora digitifera]|uniref:uncharacterized protein LOC107327186 n=1 Tax=Acropora digitifera TaxID=70779 RepID=UPI00077AE5BA|nr:PREDICTED: uncharacterized protein LOC107327186 [Acropora digitifera]
MTVPGNEVINLCESEDEISDIVEEIVKDCENCQNPTEILRCAHNKIVTGRQLDITDPTNELLGDTNFILVDRENLLETDLAEKYMTVGVAMGLSVLQNGKIPHFIPEEVLNEIIQGLSLSSCIKYLQKGLQKIGIHQLMTSLPIFLYLFRPSDGTGPSVKKLIHLLAPTFDEQGSNSRKHQKEVYNAFIRYTREVSAGRRVMGSVNITLSHILQFVFSWDPICSYSYRILPTANTCINILNLPYPSVTITLSSDEALFNLYDYAFSRAFFGTV